MNNIENVLKNKVIGNWSLYYGIGTRARSDARGVWRYEDMGCIIYYRIQLYIPFIDRVIYFAAFRHMGNRVKGA